MSGCQGDPRDPHQPLRREDQDAWNSRPAQAYALEQMRKYWEQEFAEGDPRYGFLKDTVPTAEERQGPGRFLLLDGLGGRHAIGPG